MKNKNNFLQVMLWKKSPHRILRCVVIRNSKRHLVSNRSSFCVGIHCHRRSLLPSWRKCLGLLTSVLMTW